MDLVHEENVVLLEVGEQCRQISRLFNGRAGGDAHVHSHLICDNTGQCGFTQSRGSVEKNMVKWLTAHFGRFNENGQVVFCLCLTNILVQSSGTEGILPFVR